MKKPIKVILIILAIILLMFCEYRFIMCHQHLERGHNGTIYSTVFGHTDEYYVEGWQGYETQVPCSNLSTEQDPTTRIMNEMYDAFIDAELDDKYTIVKDGNTIHITK